MAKFTQPKRRGEEQNGGICFIRNEHERSAQMKRRARLNEARNGAALLK
jgi:hypothetical protein